MFEHILLPLDGSTLAEGVLPHAVAMTRAFHSQLTLLRVVQLQEGLDQQSVVNPMDWQMRKSEAEAYLRSVKNRLEKEGIKSKSVVLEGQPSRQIIHFAHNESVNLVILSSHGESGISEWNINSVVQKVLLRAFMPVMIIRAYREASEDLTDLTYQRLLLPLDGSKRAECVLPLAQSIASAHGSTVFLAHIVEQLRLPRQTPLSVNDQALIARIEKINTEETKRYFETLSQQFPDDKVERIIESSQKPNVALHMIADREEIDLVILSAHGFSGDNRWPYGDIALNFIAYGTTPLLINQDLSQAEAALTPAEKYAAQMKGH